MRAIFIDGPGEIRVGEASRPAPGAGEVRISVGAAGICVGDLYIFRGKNPYVLYPCTPGHEVAGTVDAVGTGVTGFAEGDRVVMEPFLACGRCYACRVGKTNCCANMRILGVHLPGGYAEAVVVPVSHTHRVPEGLDLVTASFAEPLAIAVHAMRRASSAPGTLCLVLGCGPIGLAIIEVARVKGMRVWATDPNPERRGNAQALGAEAIPPEELDTRVQAETNGVGVPVVFEATGAVGAMVSTLDLVAAGGTVVIVGHVPRGTKVPFEGLDFTRKEATILGSRTSRDCFPEALELLAKGKIRLTKSATVFSMWEAPWLFQQLGQNASGLQKGILVP